MCAAKLGPRPPTKEKTLITQAPRAGPVLKTIAIYAAATLGGFCFYRLGLPLPWMIGPLVVTAALAFSERFEIRISVRTRPYGQAIVASQVGLAFSPTVFGSLLTLSPLLVGMAMVTMSIAVLMAFFLSRTARIPLSTALTATIPTSPVEAVVLAERYDFPTAPIILSQTMRISLVVVLIPLAIYLADGASQNRSAAYNPVLDLPSLAALAALSVIGVLLFRRLRISNPYFLGPLAFASAVTAAGVELDSYPSLLLWAAQILLGTWLGSNFRRSLFASAGRLVTASLVSTVLFIAACALAGAGLSTLVHLPWETMVLASAPGGVTEMALTAKFLHADVALITAFHLTRIFIIVPLIPFLIDAIHRFEQH